MINGGLMVNLNTLKAVFKPYPKKSMEDVLFAIIPMKEYYEIQLESECSKSIDESCINTECHYNYVKYHNTEMYKEIKDKMP